MHKPFTHCLALATLVTLAGAASARAGGDSFLKSDDYKEGEEVVKVFLQDEDYAKMIDDAERNDVDLDWAWVDTGDGKMKPKVKQLGFDVRSFGSVTIPEIRSFHKGMVPPEVTASVRENLVKACEHLGLEVVESGGALELGAALVDYKQDSSWTPWGNIKPFIEVEVRLRATEGDRVLALIRQQTHGDGATGAAFNFADQLMRFLQ